MKKVFRISLGILLIIVGLVALVTPLTPGSWLALIGLELVGLPVFFFQKRFLSLLPAKYRVKAEAGLDRLKRKIPINRFRSSMEGPQQDKMDKPPTSPP